MSVKSFRTEISTVTENVRKLFGDENVNWKAENSLSQTISVRSQNSLLHLYLIESIGKYRKKKKTQS